MGSRKDRTNPVQSIDGPHGDLQWILPENSAMRAQSPEKVRRLLVFRQAAETLRTAINEYPAKPVEIDLQRFREIADIDCVTQEIGEVVVHYLGNPGAPNTSLLRGSIITWYKASIPFIEKGYRRIKVCLKLSCNSLT